MNNCRTGLYGFATIMTWLRETGMASPPFLVTLGLTLPDSRILNGIASIGLTLVNIAIILPHLRQPIFDSIHASETALAHKQNALEQTNLFSDESNATQLVGFKVDSPALALAFPRRREHQGGSATVKFVCPAVTEPLQCVAADSNVAALLPAYDDQIQVPCSLGVDKVISPLTQKCQSALHIPLPAPDADAEGVASFSTTDISLSDRCPELGGAVAREQHAEDSASEDDRQIVMKAGVHAHAPSTNANDEKVIEQGGQFVADENAAPPTTRPTVLERRNLVIGNFLQGSQAEHTMVGGEEVLAKRRPESLYFIPQSVIRRYPSASSGHCVGHRAFNSGHDHQITLAPPCTLVHDPAMLPSGTIPQASCTAPKGYWYATSLAEAEPNMRSMGGKTLVIKATPAHDPLIRRLTPSPEPPTVYQLMPLKKYPTHERQLGVLARAALRNRRSAARRRRNNGIDDSSTSDSDSDCDSDSDSQYSSGSSADERMLPHMLGADLIAAIDSNSESELNLPCAKRTIRAPLDMYEDFLVSEDSAADASMIMHVSSHDDTSDGEVKAPVTLRSLTYEDIQQWASGVVQKCVRQVCRSRVPVAPLSPSQASDVCAERPSGSGISLCPLSGLHCKLGATALARVSPAKTKDLLVTPTLSTRKPLPVRNIRDIPEFVPRQRRVSVLARQVDGPSARSTIDATRDAASEVIARMESQAGFNTRQWLADETRRVSTVRGCQGAPVRA